MANKSYRGIVAFVVVIVVLVVAWGVLTVPDQRSTGQKVGDAIDALPQGVDKAARQLEDRTPGQKLGDAVKDTGETIRHNTDNK